MRDTLPVVRELESERENVLDALSDNDGSSLSLNDHSRDSEDDFVEEAVLVDEGDEEMLMVADWERLGLMERDRSADPLIVAGKLAEGEPSDVTEAEWERDSETLGLVLRLNVALWVTLLERL